MKLTKYTRQAFVRAAMDDVPEVDYNQRARDIALAAAEKLIPAEIKLLIAKSATALWVHKHWLTLPGSFSNILVATPSDSGSYWLKEKAPKVWAELCVLAKSDEKQREQRKELRLKLTACAESVTTRKALADLLPEFEKYLPVDEREAIRTLPAVANVVAEFTKAGWPKHGVAKKGKKV